MLPVIDALEPASGQAGVAYPVRVIIRGRGFLDSSNVVTFGGISIPDRPSTVGGTEIVFSAPKQRPATREVRPMALMPGDYEVTVTTPAGTSNAVIFTLTRTPDELD